MKSNGSVWLLIIVIVVAALWTLKLERQCSDRHGALVRNAWGWPICVAQENR